MDIQFGPNAVEEPNLLFKLQHKIKAFNTCDSLNNRGYNLIASSSKYGIVFIASPDSTLSVYYIKQLIDKEGDVKHVQVKLQEKPTHIGISCDYELLAVTGGQLLSVYKVVDFQMQNVTPTCNIRCDVSPSNCVSALQWNPCIPDSIAIAYFDGILLASQVSTGQIKKIASKARCICWSPKGKQLVTGNSDGSLTQYKPDLTPAKTVPAPNLFENAPVEALAIYWISTFQFAVVFRKASDNSRPALAIVNTPKAGQPSCLNYEDICYSSAPNRPWYYYLCGLPQWNIILASSSNSMEIATLGSADGANWLQWCQSDEARPELPLTDKKLENYPVGVCIDTGANHQLPWGENETLPYMPLMLVLSHSGLLTIFNIINMNKQAPQICASPQNLMLPANAMTSEIPGVAPAPAQMQPSAAPPAQPQVQPAQQTMNPPPFQSIQPTQVPQPAVGLFSSFVAPAKPIDTQPLAPPPEELKQKQAMIQNIPPVVQPQARKVQTPKPVSESKPIQSPEVNAALKEEQEKITKLKADQELKGMLLKEVNDFQNEVYKFNVKVRDGQNELYKDINSLTSDFDLQSLDVDQLRKDCGLEELRAAVVQLKLDLVRGCAAVAETRTHTEMKDFHEWSHADPLTTKRVANIKKMAYYVQNQLEQAQKALDHKWSDMLSKNPMYNKPGQRMIRPILDDIYQPLVKQQEILGRQQVVLRTLRNALNECNTSPLLTYTSILRTTPLKNKDNLSKLTKNILNMSIEPKMPKSEGYLSAQKLDALRDMLANRRPTKIKPVNVEMTQHLKAVRLSYEQSLKEKAAQQTVAKSQTQAQVQQTIVESTTIPQMKPQSKPDLVKPAQTPIQQPPSQQPTIQQRTVQQPTVQQPKLPTFNSINNLKPHLPQATNQSIQPGLANMARTLLTDQSTTIPQMKPQSKPDLVKPAQTPIQQPPSQTCDTRQPIVQQQPTPLQPTIQQPTVQQPTKQQPTVQQPTVQQPTVQQPTVQQPTLPTFNSINNLKPHLPQAMNQSVQPGLANVARTLFTDQSLQELPKPQSSSTPIQSQPPKPLITQEKPASDPPISTPTVNTKSVLKDLLQSKSALANLENKSDNTFMGQKICSPSSFTLVPKVTSEEKSAENTPATAATSSASSIFASANASKPLTGGTSPSLFGAASPNQTTKSLFGSAQPSPSSSIFSPTIVSSSSQMGSIFGSKSATPSTDAAKAVDTDSKAVPSSVTITPITTSSDVKSIFGSNKSEAAKTKVESTTESSSKVEPTPTTATPAFAYATTTAESTPSIFSTPTPATSAPVLSNQSAFATTESSVFGSSASSVFASANSQQSSSIFGAAPATTSQSVFGASTTTTQSAFAATTKESVFAAAPLFGAAATTAQSAFGSATATTQSSIFGGTTAPTPIFGSPTTQASVFGGQPTSVFGSSAQGAAQTTQSSVFGAPTTQAFSIFGAGASNTTQSSIFGSPPVTTASGGSLFGGGESSLFSAASISTTSAPSQSTGSIFGGSPGSAFSNTGTNVFGGKTTFGQPNPAAASIFGNSATFGQKQDNANNFWGANNNADAEKSNWFGKDQATTQASSIFGGASGGSFSAASPGGAFGSPQPQGSVFGSPQQQIAPAFGGSAGFGSKAVFGQTTGFGSPPASGGFGSFGGFNKSPSSGFGGPAAFGAASSFGAPAFGGSSPGKMFGGAADAGPAFGATQSNATFENLATQNTLSFGNLAQQSQAPQQAAPSFNTSPSFTGWRG